MNELDEKIKKMVQSVKLNVPEDQFMDKLKQLKLDKSVQKIKSRRFWPVIATAASLVMVVFLFVFFYLIKSPINQKRSWDSIQFSTFNKSHNSKIVIRSIHVNKQPAKTFYFQSKNKDKVIIWVQKNI